MEMTEKQTEEMNAKLPCRLTGPVVRGKGKGRTVGMPTVNLGIGKETVLPPLGVYATRVYLGDETYVGVTNVGTRPSVDDEDQITVETLILDFDRDIYDWEITVEFLHFIRPIRKMESLKAVRLQVERDSLVARERVLHD